MIIASEIRPTHALASFVRCYAYREFDTHGLDVVKPWYASHEVYLPFFFKDLPVRLISPDKSKILKTGSHCDVVGLCSNYNGEMIFNGYYSLLQIIFRTDGFNKIFKIPSSETADHIISSDEIIGPDIKLLHEQLFEAGNLTEMATLLDKYLLYRLKKQKYAVYENGLTNAINFIVNNPGLTTVDKIAYNANVSIRNLERRFISEVGISPKHFCCVTRFSKALEMKLKNPGLDWTSIAYIHGYFDQMHLIKDFKKFSGKAPLIFIKQTDLSMLEEKY